MKLKKGTPTNKGVHHTREAILKMKKAHTGKKLSLEHRKKIGSGNLGKRLSEEQRNKIHLAHVSKPRENPTVQALAYAKLDRVIRYKSKMICTQCGSDKTYVRRRRNKPSELEEDWRHDSNYNTICRKCYNTNFRVAHPRDNASFEQIQKEKQQFVKCLACGKLRPKRDKQGFLRLFCNGCSTKGKLFKSRQKDGMPYDQKYRTRVLRQADKHVPRPADGKCQAGGCEKPFARLLSKSGRYLRYDDDPDDYIRVCRLHWKIL